MHELHTARKRAQALRLVADALTQRAQQCSGRWAKPAAHEAALAEDKYRTARTYADQLTDQHELTETT